MRDYLSRTISSLNPNKLNGLLAEVEFRRHLATLGYEDRVSRGGWIVRSEGPVTFGQTTVALFPETVIAGIDYPLGRTLPQPDLGLHTICGTFHQSGIVAHFCAATVGAADDSSSIGWQSMQLGLPTQQPYQAFPQGIPGFRARGRKYGFLRYHANAALIPPAAVPEEFSKEHLRVNFQGSFLSEISDIDGIFWGQQITYPLEIKEKTVANGRRLGDYFGLDLGPFVKLAFYASKRGNLHSLFIVREINSVAERQLVGWWFIPFDRLAQVASWNPRAGGTGMQGGRSTVVQIPKSEFEPLDAAHLDRL